MGCECVDPDSEVPNGATSITSTDLSMIVKSYANMMLRGGKAIPLFVYGSPGIGKTDIINAVGHELKLPVYTFIASTMEASDVRGIPFPNTVNKTTEWLPPSEFKRQNKPAIYFFDELNTADMSVRTAFYQLILSGKLGDIDISNSLRIGAGNNKGFVPEIKNLWLGTPLATRFDVYWMIPDYYGWLDWAKTHKINPIILEFLEANHMGSQSKKGSNFFYCVSPSVACQGINMATPRGWAKVSDLISYGLDAPVNFQSAVGVIPGKAFYTFYRNTLENRKTNIQERESTFEIE